VYSGHFIIFRNFEKGKGGEGKKEKQGGKMETQFLRRGRASGRNNLGVNVCNMTWACTVCKRFCRFLYICVASDRVYTEACFLQQMILHQANRAVFSFILF